MRVAIIDDENSVRETIKAILLHYFPDLNIQEASNVSEGVELMSSFRPQLIFLDIEMRDGTGFDLLTRLPEIPGVIVFVTAHDHYAVKAFKFNALDYILKPADPKEIIHAVEKAAHGQHDLHRKKINGLLHQQSEVYDKIILSDQANVHIVPMDEIIRCNAVGNYTHFFLTGNRELIISKTLKYYDELLGEYNFIRVHQSHLINLRHLSSYDKRDGGLAVMRDNSIVPVATRKKDMLQEIFKRFKS